MRSLFLLFSFILLTACSGDSVDNPNCRFLLDIDIYERVNLTLLPGNKLSSGTSIPVESSLHRGIIVSQVGLDYYAWDAADPNHTFNGTCKLKPTNNINTFDLTATCSCDDKNTYSLVTGQALNDGSLQCGLKNYRVEKSGNLLLISN